METRAEQSSSTTGMHHFHIRKRVHENLEPYPHPNKWKRFMDKAIYVVGAFGLVMTLPQLMNIWVDQNAAGVSVVSWGAYLVCAIFWLAYGLLHRVKPIIYTNSVWIVLETMIITGALMYG